MNNNISAGTIARTICLALALTNQVLSATGHAVLPIEDAQVETLVTTGLTVAASVAAWWDYKPTEPEPESEIESRIYSALAKAIHEGVNES